VPHYIVALVFPSVVAKADAVIAQIAVDHECRLSCKVVLVG
jgi:hypothetical protein